MIKKTISTFAEWKIHSENFDGIKCKMKRTWEDR